MAEDKLTFEYWLEAMYGMTSEELSKEDKMYRRSIRDEYKQYCESAE